MKQILAQNNFVSWGELRQRALRYVREGLWLDQYDYVIVDEAQDLPPTAIALCLELCRDPAGFFLTADASQSLYNRGFRWKEVHASLKVRGRTVILKRNYRTTREIVQAAANILGSNSSGDVDTQQETVHCGNRPLLRWLPSKEEQMVCLADRIRAACLDLRLPIGAAAILTPTKELARYAADQLNRHGLKARYMTGRELNLEAPEIKVLTLHSAKGLEFPIVAIPFVQDGLLPRTLTGQVEDWEVHLNSERRLFYVGCTRAMRYLFVTSDEYAPSLLLNDLSPEYWELGES